MEAGLREPEFEQTENFRATIWRRNVGQNVAQDDADNKQVTKNVGQDVGQDVGQRNEAEAALNQGIARDWIDGNVTQNVAQTDGNVAQTKAQKRKGERYIKVMNTLLTNRRVPQREIAAMLGVTRRTINRDLDALRMTYRIEWIGGSRKGRWEIERK